MNPLCATAFSHHYLSKRYNGFAAATVTPVPIASDLLQSLDKKI